MIKLMGFKWGDDSNICKWGPWDEKDEFDEDEDDNYCENNNDDIEDKNNFLFDNEGADRLMDPPSFHYHHSCWLLAHC